MITLRMYESKHREALDHYPLSEEQLGFTGHPIEMLKRLKCVLPIHRLLF